MKKRIFALLLTLTMLALSGVAAYAEYSSIPSERQLDLLVDEAGLLDGEEAASLLETLEEISERQQLEVAVVTVNDIGYKTPTEFADDFYDYNGYGYGENDDGILLLLNMGERDWAITTYGSAIQIFRQYAQNSIMQDSGVLSYLGNGDYYEAFMTFAKECDNCISSAGDGSGENYDYYYNYNYNYPDEYTPSSPSYTVTEKSFPFLKILTCILLGFVASFIIMKLVAAPLKSVKSKSGADDYMTGSARITEARDVFLYSNITKTRIDPDSGNYHSGSSSGGHTHVSSSGRSHGGSSGKF